jgi:hypothetical protein
MMANQYKLLDICCHSYDWEKIFLQELLLIQRNKIRLREWHDICLVKASLLSFLLKKPVSPQRLAFSISSLRDLPFSANEKSDAGLLLYHPAILVLE